MNRIQAFDTTPRKERALGVHGLQRTWALKLFTMAAEDMNSPSDEAYIATLSNLLTALDSRLSDEFVYGRFGCAILHSGRRGTCLTITHFGSWGTTFEVFSSAWYQYGRGVTSLSPLDDTEPAMCWFEFPRTFYEVRYACLLAKHHDLAGVREHYLAQQT